MGTAAAVPALIITVAAFEAWYLTADPFGFEKGVGDPAAWGLIAVGLIWAVLLAIPMTRRAGAVRYAAAELLAALGLILFLYAYIFASNANMDYARRFAETTGNLRLAPDTRLERLDASIRYVPLILPPMLHLAVLRIRQIRTRFTIQAVALPLVVISALLHALSFPSFVDPAGWGFLGFLCMVPLYVVLFSTRTKYALFYVPLFGVLQGLAGNFWLGTFHLIALQIMTVVYMVQHLLLAVVISPFLKTRYRTVLIAAGWLLFDFFRSKGFLGFSWGMLGTTQYRNLPLIQFASVTGVWGVSFLLYFVNSLTADLLLTRRKARMDPLYACAVLLMFASGFGGIRLWREATAGPSREATTDEKSRPWTIALIQQNSDPRKHDYAETFEKLVDLTDAAMESQPDLVAWSETAFVPNIRRWGNEPPDSSSLARLTHRFLEYQRSLGTWLLTGNDDYERIETDEGIVRKNYNAAILFAPDGTRMETYHKINLVPFTEDFPYEKRFPGFYTFLQSYKVSLWERGTERVIFTHPRFSFFTPICFEDGFPHDIRKFAAAGGDIILNLSNDYWSLSEVEAAQHYAGSVFRAVETGLPLLRSTASGVTCHVEPTGRPAASLPVYEEGFLVVRVTPRSPRRTPYVRFGDWFPWLILLIAVVFSIMKTPTKNRTNYSGSPNVPIQ